MTRAYCQYDLNGRGIRPIVSPRTMFNDLFFNFSSNNPAEEAQRIKELAKRKSVLDLIDKTASRKIA